MVAVGVVAGEAAGLAAGELSGLRVVGCGLFPGGAAGQRAEFQQRAGCRGAVEVAVGDDGAVVGAFGAAVVRVQVLDELRACGSEREGPGISVAVGVAEPARSRRADAAAGIAVGRATRARTGSGGRTAAWRGGRAREPAGRSRRAS